MSIIAQIVIIIIVWGTSISMVLDLSRKSLVSIVIRIFVSIAGKKKWDTVKYTCEKHKRRIVLFG